MHVDRATYRQLKAKYRDEMVFVVPHHNMTHIADKFTPRTAHENVEHLEKYDSMGHYILRCDAEHNRSFQQLIPYVIVKNSAGKYFVADRLSGDERLTGQKILGFGGHIDQTDTAPGAILKGMMRELHEELHIKIKGTPSYVGTIRDLSGTTSDHTGFVFEVQASSCKIKETHKLKGKWMTLDELVSNYFTFESWAKMYIDHLYEASYVTS